MRATLPRPLVGRRRPRGQSMVEFALLLPVLLMLAVIALDFGRLFFSYIQVTNAAREAAVYAAGNPTDSAGITAHGTQEVNAQGQGGEGSLTFAATCADQLGVQIGCGTAAAGSGGGNTITVAASEQFTFLTPIIGSLFGGSLNLSASASSAVLQLAASGGSAPATCQTLPVPSFTVAVSNLTVNLDASTSTPTGGQCAIASYDWDMGDGASLTVPVTGTTTSYTYGTGGHYTITLTVGNPAGTANAMQTLDIGVTPSPTPTPTPSPTATPTPSPTATPTAAPICNYVPSITANETGHSGKYTFTGAYTGQPAPTSWRWDLGDATVSTLQNPPQHNYSGSGPWTVTLTIQGGSCGAQSTTYEATK
jgi:PKD repeat protein